MKSEIVQLVFALIALVVGGALEEMLPKVYGVGAPVLMTAAAFFASRRPLVAALAFALAAGAMEDWLSAGAPGVCGSLALFFVMAYAVRRTQAVPALAVALAYPCCQVLFFFGDFFVGRGGEVCLRFLAAIPVGAATAAATCAFLAFMERRAAIGEA